MPVLKPAHPRDPGVPGRAGRAGARLRARWSPTARCCRRAALDDPAARLGQPALLAAARLARRGARAARDLGGRRGDRRDDVPDRARSSTPARRSALMTETIRPTDTAGDLLARLAEGGAGLLVRDPRRHRGRLAGGARAAGRRRQPRPEDHRRGRPGRLDRAGGRGRPPGPRVHPGTRRVDDVRRRAAQARTRARPTRTTSRSRPAARDRARTPCTSAPPPTRCGSARCSRTASKQMPAADWARGAAARRGEPVGLG